MLRALAVTLLFLLSCTPVAVAGSLPNGTIVHGDGANHVIIQSADTAAVRLVVDTDPLDAGTVLAPPEGCTVGAIGGGKLLAGCQTDSYPAVDLRLSAIGSDDWTTPAGLATYNAWLKKGCCADNEYLTAAGVSNLLIGIGWDSSHGSFTDWFDASTGARVAGYSESPHRFFTTDSPTGTAPLCAPVVRALRDYEAAYTGWTTTRQPATQVGSWTARWWRDVRLQRCGSTRVLRFDGGLNSNVLLTDRFAAWASKQTLHVVWLSGGRHQQIALRKPIWRPVGYALTGTRHRLFLTMQGGSGWPVQWFQLP